MKKKSTLCHNFATYYYIFIEKLEFLLIEK